VSAHFARLGNPRVDDLSGRAVRCAREHPDAHGGEGERIDSLLDKTRERCVDVVVIARALSNYLQPKRALPPARR
jgi:hypothetical protein